MSCTHSTGETANGASQAGSRSMTRSRSTAAAYGAQMEQPRPLILVDVDGVLNPARSHALGYRGHWVFPGGLAHRLLLNPSHGPMLTELAGVAGAELDRKSTRLNSSHPSISYAVFCLKKKK